MAFHLFHQSEESKVDLTLRLGQSDNHNEKIPSTFGNNANSVPMTMTMTSRNSKVNFNASYTRGNNNHYSMVYGGRNLSSGQNNGRNQKPWSPIKMGNIILDTKLNQFGKKTSSLGGDHVSYSTSFYKKTSFSPLSQTNNYTLLNISSKRAERDNGGSSGSERKSTRRRTETIIYNDPNMRCTNYNCRTNNTPMWRKGPLGPKTLCNACGIRYRKEEEKRKADEAAN